MAHQLTTQPLRRRTLAFLQLRAREIPAGMPDPSADLTLLVCDGLSGSLTLGYATKPWMANVWGVVHGGVTAALVDTCMGITCAAQCGSTGTPTITMTVNYARPVPPDADIRVRAHTVRVGHSSGQMSAEVFLPEAPDELLVTATGVYSVKRPRP